MHVWGRWFSLAVRGVCGTGGVVFWAHLGLYSLSILVFVYLYVVGVCMPIPSSNFKILFKTARAHTHGPYNWKRPEKGLATKRRMPAEFETPPIKKQKNKQKTGFPSNLGSHCCLSK